MFDLITVFCCFLLGATLLICAWRQFDDYEPLNGFLCCIFAGPLILCGLNIIHDKYDHETPPAPATSVSVPAPSPASAPKETAKTGTLYQIEFDGKLVNCLRYEDGSNVCDMSSRSMPDLSGADKN